MQINGFRLSTSAQVLAALIVARHTAPLPDLARMAVEGAIALEDALVQDAALAMEDMVSGGESVDPIGSSIAGLSGLIRAAVLEGEAEAEIVQTLAGLGFSHDLILSAVHELENGDA